MRRNYFYTKIRGFTLVELLVVIGILAVLLAITLIAINPLEQINKTRDVTTKSAARDFASATKYYFTSEKSLPWVKNQSCHDELATEKTLSNATACTDELTKGGQLQKSLINSDESKNIFITECNGAVALCYHPYSQQFGKDPEAIYTKNGVIQPGCPSASQECYSCTFTTNEAQECFQALNPNNGVLAIGPTPAPGEILPIPDRHSKSTCNEPIAGEVSCMAKVVTDSNGTPLASIGLPAGFGPNQIHTAYNLPCTPGGSVNSKCNAPQVFGPQIVAVILAYHTPTIESDLETYSKTYGLPPCTVANGCLTIVNQNGATSPLPSVDPNWALEASLDVQMSHAVCQTCKILLVEANSNSIANLAAATDRAALMGATSISNSYGAAEWSGQTAYDGAYSHPGIAVVAASGDWGYGAYYPAASKNVIAVGGTTLSLLADDSYSSESVWSGTGSGCSLYETASNYQTNLSNWGLTGCGIKKGITDVAAVASPNTGVAVYDSTPYSGHSGWWILGGTSVSSPIIGASISLQGGIPSDAIGPSVLYSDLSKFRDVTSGSNGSCGGKTACTASAGYDGPTGLGSINLLPPQNQSPTIQPTQIPTPTANPSSTPTPTQAQNCSSQQSVSLQTPTPIQALPGDTVNNTLIVTSNDSPGCSALYTISYGYPTGWGLNGIPPSFTLAGGATKNIPITITAPISSLNAGTYVFQFWVAKQGQSTVNPINGYVQITQGSPTLPPTTPPTPTVKPSPTPTPTLYPTKSPIDYNGIVPGYGIDQSKFFRTYAVYFFDYPGFPPSGAGWNMQISTRSDFSAAYPDQLNSYGIPDSYGQDSPINTSYAALRAITRKYVGIASIDPYDYDKNHCGQTIYWRITNFYSPFATDKKYGPTYTGVIDCTTKVNVVDPPISWYSVFGQGSTERQKYYEPAWDFDKNGVIDWTDYWLGAFSTKIRAGGWQPPE